MTYLDHNPCPASDWPIFSNVADRLEAHDDPGVAKSGITVRQANHLCVKICGGRPFVPFALDNRAETIAGIRAMVEDMKRDE